MTVPRMLPRRRHERLKPRRHRLPGPNRSQWAHAKRYHPLRYTWPFHHEPAYLFYTPETAFALLHLSSPEERVT